MWKRKAGLEPVMGQHDMHGLCPVLLALKIEAAQESKDREGPKKVEKARKLFLH